MAAFTAISSKKYKPKVLVQKDTPITFEPISINICEMLVKLTKNA